MKQGERTMAREEVAPIGVNNDVERAMAVPLAKTENEKPKVLTAEEILAEQERLLKESEARKPKEEARAKEIQESIQTPATQGVIFQDETLPTLPSREEFIDSIVKKHLQMYTPPDTIITPEGKRIDTRARGPIQPETLDYILKIKDGKRIEKDLQEELAKMWWFKRFFSPQRNALMLVRAGLRKDNLGGKFYIKFNGNLGIFERRNEGQSEIKNPDQWLVDKFPDNWDGLLHYQQEVSEAFGKWQKDPTGVDLDNIMKEIDRWWEKSEELRLQKEAEHILGEQQAKKETKQRVEEEMQELLGGSN